jgi:hypothetical protein
VLLWLAVQFGATRLAGQVKGGDCEQLQIDQSTTLSI